MLQVATRLIEPYNLLRVIYGSMFKVGCKDNNDCTEGLECQGEGAERKCQDFNECTDPRFKPDADAFCGPNTDCVNSVGSYSCTCKAGQGLS